MSKKLSLKFSLLLYKTYTMAELDEYRSWHGWKNWIVESWSNSVFVVYLKKNDIIRKFCIGIMINVSIYPFILRNFFLAPNSIVTETEGKIWPRSNKLKRRRKDDFADDFYRLKFHSTMRPPHDVYTNNGFYSFGASYLTISFDITKATGRLLLLRLQLTARARSYPDAREATTIGCATREWIQCKENRSTRRQWETVCARQPGMRRPLSLPQSITPTY